MTSLKGGLIKALLEPPLSSSMPLSRTRVLNLFLVVSTRLPVCVSGADLLYASFTFVSSKCFLHKLLRL